MSEKRSELLLKKLLRSDINMQELTEFIEILKSETTKDECSALLEKHFDNLVKKNKSNNPEP